MFLGAYTPEPLGDYLAGLLSLKPNLDGIGVGGELLRLGQGDDLPGNGFQSLPAELQHAHGLEEAVHAEGGEEPGRPAGGQVRFE